MNLTKQICHKAAHFDAVAFDVFDTLIKRDVAVPTGLFRLMGDDFYAARIRAEREARAAQSREVTLAEIDARPCLARYDAAAECAAELAACAANKPVLDAVQTLKKQGKKLYYISDMYLPQTQIDAMLRRCGYPCFDGGFVSCTYGVQKRSGRLFKRFLQETGLTAKQLLFIGDSWRADVAGAALAVPLLLIVLVMDRVLGRESMGGGDIKLFFTVGLFGSLRTDLLVLLLACLIGIGLAFVPQKTAHEGEPSGAIPFGPAISAAAVLSLLWGEPFVAAYLSLFA